MSKIIKFNTEDALSNDVKPVEQIPIFNLVTPKLEKTPVFDFSNPPVDPMAFASSLVETCIKAKGISLSAPQCGYPYRVFVMGANQEYVAFFNPRLLGTSTNDAHLVEGCLSHTGLAVRITRPASISVHYQDFNGVSHETEFYGMTARAFQHELDHLDGTDYSLRAKPLAMKSALKKQHNLFKSAEKFSKLIKK